MNSNLELTALVKCVSASRRLALHPIPRPGTPSRGVTIYKLADTGLMASADISGTRFWRLDNLNP